MTDTNATNTTKTAHNGWRIESRMMQVAGLGGHNYLALIAPDGTVHDEIHGWRKKTLEGQIELKFESTRQLIEKGAEGKDNLAAINAQPRIEGSGTLVPLNGKNAHAVWKDFTRSANDISGVTYHFTGQDQSGAPEQDPRDHGPKPDIRKGYNSNSFWATILRNNGYDPAALKPKNWRLTPGVDTHIPSQGNDRQTGSETGTGSGTSSDDAQASPDQRKVPPADQGQNPHQDEEQAESHPGASSSAQSQKVFKALTAPGDEVEDMVLKQDLTDDELGTLMRSPDYLSPSSSRHADVQNRVSRWYTDRYGDDALDRDATGRMIEPAVKTPAPARPLPVTDRHGRRVDDMVQRFARTVSTAATREPAPDTVRRVQDVLNTFPMPGKPPLKIDGVPGPKTRSALRTTLARHGEAPLHEAFTLKHLI